MTSAPGIVTHDSRAFEKMIVGSPSVVRELAMATRGLIYDVLPATVEVVWPQQRNAGYGTGPKKMAEQFSWLALAKQHLTFGFYYGTELPDPDSLLEGTGGLMRHVKIRTIEDVKDPALRAMLEAAITHRIPPPPPTAS